MLPHLPLFLNPHKKRLPLKPTLWLLQPLPLLQNQLFDPQAMSGLQRVLLT